MFGFRLEVLQVRERGKEGGGAKGYFADKMLFDGVCVVGELFQEREGVRDGGGIGGVLVAMNAFRDSVESGRIREIKVWVKEDGGDGGKGREELRCGGRVGRRGSGNEEAVPLWSDCAEVAIKVAALYAGEDGGLYGGQRGMWLWRGVALVGIVEHVGHGWGR